LFTDTAFASPPSMACSFFSPHSSEFAVLNLLPTSSMARLFLSPPLSFSQIFFFRIRNHTIFPLSPCKARLLRSSPSPSSSCSPFPPASHCLSRIELLVSAILQALSNWRCLAAFRSAALFSLPFSCFFFLFFSFFIVFFFGGRVFFPLAFLFYALCPVSSHPSLKRSTVVFLRPTRSAFFEPLRRVNFFSFF